MNNLSLFHFSKLASLFAATLAFGASVDNAWADNGAASEKFDLGHMPSQSLGSTESYGVEPILFSLSNLLPQKKPKAHPSTFDSNGDCSCSPSFASISGKLVEKEKKPQKSVVKKPLAP